MNKNRTSSLLHKKTNLSNVLLLNTPMKTNQNQYGRREGNNMLKNVFGPWHQTKMIWSFSVLTLLLFLNSNSPNIAGALVLRFPLSRALYSSLSADSVVRRDTAVSALRGADDLRCLRALHNNNKLTLANEKDLLK